MKVFTIDHKLQALDSSERMLHNFVRQMMGEDESARTRRGWAAVYAEIRDDLRELDELKNQVKQLTEQ